MIIHSPRKLEVGSIQRGLMYVGPKKISDDSFIESKIKFMVMRESSLGEFLEYHKQEMNHDVTITNELKNKLFYKISVD